MMSRDVLYVSRKYPPSIGGMERLALAISQALTSLGPARQVTLGRSQRNLVWFLPWAAMRMLVNPPELLVFGDVLVAALLWPFNRARRTAVVVHGLDITFGAAGYGLLIRAAFRRIDRFLAISENTARLLEQLGVDASTIRIVYPGVEEPQTKDASAPNQARERLGIPSMAPLLVFVGRLVPRKGIAWFVGDVFPRLACDVHLVIVGEGPDRAVIEQVLLELGSLRERVHLVGSVPDWQRDMYMRGADMAIMPNIPTKDDPEGFGLVAIESTLRGTPVLGTKVDAVVEALAGGECGFLVDPLDGVAMADEIGRLIDHPKLVEMAASFAAVAAERFTHTRFRERLGDALTFEP